MIKNKPPYTAGTDPRYRQAGIALKEGSITTFEEIFQIVPGIIVAKDWGVNLNVFNLVMIDNGIISADRYVWLAEWMDVPPLEMLALATAHYVKYKGMQKNRPKQRRRFDPGAYPDHL